MAKINKEKEALVPYKLLIELLRYDYETGMFYWLVSKGKAKAGRVAGCVGEHGYVQIGINGYVYKAHRLAWLMVYGDFPNGEQPNIDHVNGVRDDNRIANLKVSSVPENNKNLSRNSRNKSGINGVRRTSCWNGTRTKLNWYWVADWYDENGKLCRKSFNIEKLGEKVAKAMATAHRAEQICLLELNYSITYSDRHGK